MEGDELADDDFVDSEGSGVKYPLEDLKTLLLTLLNRLCFREPEGEGEGVRGDGDGERDGFPIVCEYYAVEVC